MQAHYFNFKLLLFFVLLQSSFFAQEFMHWKNLDGEKTERVKTKTVWQYPCSSNSQSKHRIFFSYEKRDIFGRVEALRMYSPDTNFYSYDSEGEQRTVNSNGKKLVDFKKVIKYSKTGKIIYEHKGGVTGYERFYFYDSLDRECKMIIPPLKGYYYEQDTIVNLIIYALNGKDSLRRHYEGGKLTREQFFEYDHRKNCIKHISCDYHRINSCDTTQNAYNANNQVIYSLQKYYLGQDTVLKTEEKKYVYDSFGRMRSAEDGVSICYWKYNSRGYVIEAKRYDKPGELRFFAKYEYTFWRKKDYRKLNKPKFTSKNG
ncbi:MAG: hypothetical protein IT236_03165 [Bacteroidia bacterium]|nr:hypothetical protein [Bacteroidia bacterium]